MEKKDEFSEGVIIAQPPKYIQVLALLEPNQRISFNEIARIGCIKFGWYDGKGYERRRSMQCMLRAALAAYPHVVDNSGIILKVDSNEALELVEEKMAAHDDSTQFTKGFVEKIEIQKKEIILKDEELLRAEAIREFEENEEKERALIHEKNQKGLVIKIRTFKRRSLYGFQVAVAIILILIIVKNSELPSKEMLTANNQSNNMTLKEETAFLYTSTKDVETGDSTQVSTTEAIDVLSSLP